MKRRARNWKRSSKDKAGGKLMHQPQVVVIGNIINETILFPDKTVGPVLGSPAAYSSVVMSAVGTHVGLVSYFGPDMKEAINAHMCRVDRRGMILTEQSTTNRLIYREDGTKYVEYLHKAPVITAGDIFGGYLQSPFFYICPMDYEVDMAVNRMLFEAGKTVVVDMGGYGGATSYQHHTIYKPEGEAIISDVARYATVIKASSEDLSHIAPNTAIDDVCSFFFSKGATMCVVTLGEKGSYYRQAGDNGVHVPGCVSHCPVDFTGAGDSFGAGLMASLSSGRDIHDAVVFGNAVASLVIEKTGGCVWARMPGPQQVAERINQ
jgi:sugar/nucleoside kinase (ribokinase family)